MSSEKGLVEKAEKAKIANRPVGEFMKQPDITFSPDTRVETAIRGLQNKSVSGACVLDAASKLIGFVSEHDLLLQAASQDVTAPIAYKKEVVTLTEKDTLKTALTIMFKNKFRRLPVVNAQKKFLGMVSRIDILSQIIQHS